MSKLASLMTAIGLLTSVGGIANAGDREPLVLELFTSQGCSSCPAADKVLGELAKREDVLALTFNVDYWDYLGWKDTLANHAWTERQRAYGRVLASRYVYTPQLVVGGQNHVVGSDRREANKLIEKFGSQTKTTLTLKSTAPGKTILAVSPTESGKTLNAGIFFVRYEPQQTVAIGRGENAGETVTYYNVVRKLERLGSWQGEATEVEIPADLLNGTGRSAVFIQANGPGIILGALKLPQQSAALQ